MLRIAMISTVYKQTPPVGYGGIERVVHTLTQELVARGHEVTLFATPGSHCAGNTVEIEGYNPAESPSGIHSKSAFLSEEPLFDAMAERLTPDRFDVVHDFSFSNLFVTRFPERLPFIISVCVPIDAALPRRNLVACSAAHARLLGNGACFVRYGLDLTQWPARYDKSKHLVHIAKIAPYKGQHEAALAAALARRELHIVGNVEHGLYHRSLVQPLTWMLPRVSYHGETASTRDLLLPAAALVQTPKWFDAFPLIVLEALACGTPIIAYAEGGVSEQIEHGVNGFICHGIRELAEMMRRVDEIDPRACRQYAEDHFSVNRMADEYCALYYRVMDGEAW
jgi:glycosyltransferase involved in cell wall biosynthesis